MMHDDTPLLERKCGCGRKISSHGKHELEICCNSFGTLTHNIKIIFAEFFEKNGEPNG